MNIFTLRGAQLLALIFTWCALGLGSWTFASDLIVDFDEARDAKDLIDLFKQEAHWLTNDSYSPEFMIRYKAPNADPRYMGKLHIKVCRVNDQFIGFCSYYMRSPGIGQSFISAVKPQFRGKNNGGYAELMLHYRIDDMKKMGAKTVWSYTLPNNMPAQGLLKRVGFHEIGRGENWVLYSYDL